MVRSFQKCTYQWIPSYHASTSNILDTFTILVTQKYLEIYHWWKADTAKPKRTVCYTINGNQVMCLYRVCQKVTPLSIMLIYNVI